jgi:hypothetical protein
MEQIYSAMSDFVGWIEEEYGVVAAWAAVILVLAVSVGIVLMTIAWFAR